MMRALVTGATGFVGRHSLNALLQSGAEIHAVSRQGGLDRAGLVWHRCDLLQEGDRARLIERVKPTHLLHFAWATEHGQFWDMAENHLWLQASYDLIQRFSHADGQRAVVAGSCAEYDWQDPALAAGAVCDERSTPARPATLYGRCKLALLDWLGAQPGLSHAWGRIFFAYGPGEDRRRLVPSVILSLLANQPAEIGPGTQIRDFLDVRDIAAAFVSLLISPVEGVVNIGTGLGVSIADLARAIALAMGRSDLLAIGALPARACDPPYLVPKIDRLQSEVGFSPSFTQKTGLEQAIAWWRHHQQGELS